MPHGAVPVGLEQTEILSHAFIRVPGAPPICASSGRRWGSVPSPAGRATLGSRRLAVGLARRPRPPTRARFPKTVTEEPAVQLFQHVTDPIADADIIRRRRYGVIEVAGGQLTRIRLRPWPKISTAPGVLLGGWCHDRRPGDQLQLYYNQPRRFPRYLVLRYVVSTRNTSMRSLVRALGVLDEVARLKQSDALMCDVGNPRIDQRIMTRFGWEPHCPSRWHRHYIKRFYGTYPPRPTWLAQR